MTSVRSNNLSSKYLRFTPSSGKDMGIRKFEFVSKTRLLCRTFYIKIFFLLTHFCCLCISIFIVYYLFVGMIKFLYFLVYLIINLLMRPCILGDQRPHG